MNQCSLLSNDADYSDMEKDALRILRNIQTYTEDDILLSELYFAEQEFIHLAQSQVKAPSVVIMQRTKEKTLEVI